MLKQYDQKISKRTIVKVAEVFDYNKLLIYRPIDQAQSDNNVKMGKAHWKYTREKNARNIFFTLTFTSYKVLLLREVKCGTAGRAISQKQDSGIHCPSSTTGFQCDFHKWFNYYQTNLLICMTKGLDKITSKVTLILYKNPI